MSNPNVPLTVEQRAEQAGRDATERFLAEYNAELKAHEYETVARENGTAPPPAWMADDPCDAWCLTDVDHEAGTHPDDRRHYGPTEFIPLATMEPVVIGYPLRWDQPTLQLSLERRYREREGRMAIAVNDETFAWATIDEAEEIGRHILAMVEQARGGWKPVPAPFDAHGRCEDRACRHCWTATGEMVEAQA